MCMPIITTYLSIDDYIAIWSAWLSCWNLFSCPHHCDSYLKIMGVHLWLATPNWHKKINIICTATHISLSLFCIETIEFIQIYTPYGYIATCDHWNIILSRKRVRVFSTFAVLALAQKTMKKIWYKNDILLWHWKLGITIFK